MLNICDQFTLNLYGINMLPVKCHFPSFCIQMMIFILNMQSFHGPFIIYCGETYLYYVGYLTLWGWRDIFFTILKSGWEWIYPKHWEITPIFLQMCKIITPVLNTDLFHMLADMCNIRDMVSVKSVWNKSSCHVVIQSHHDSLHQTKRIIA